MVVFPIVSLFRPVTAGLGHHAFATKSDAIKKKTSCNPTELKSGNRRVVAAFSNAPSAVRGTR